ncbi:hypothetical protein [Burkholderia cenocepacia]|jgi:hypothetical protein|uniref:hypothetical protein n=1 Tax=Burkholderia cenocepacia TaxID=95486 RepID=UPI00264E32A7|nr:hypothetical protein [Burkholderia cenocepacia]MDN7458587.1 hypothetical protein [Burkholderia cenocepacia]MEB2544551.1 hypothetical protein [Burkholderia cenocepacia]
MQNLYEKRRVFQAATATFAVVAALGLSACGGGDDGGSGSSAVSSGASSSGAPSGSASSSSGIRVEGQSQSISSQYSTVRILMPPASWNGAQMPNGTYTLRALSQPATGLKEQAPGAYVAIPYDSSGTIKTLTKGVVTDLAGNGDIAIGRWADGADSSGATYNANQGQVWAIGVPVAIDTTAPVQMQCSLAFATRPTSADGNTAPGSLAGATATLTSGTNTSGNTAINYTLNLQYSIGNDRNQSFVGSSTVGLTELSSKTKSTLMSTVMGSDAKQPYLIVSYGIPATTTGNINGLVALSCK